LEAQETGMSMRGMMAGLHHIQRAVDLFTQVDPE